MSNGSENSSRSPRAALFALSIGLAYLLLAVSDKTTQAAEDGKGFYLLGSGTSLAGVVPPPGTYGTS